MIDLSQDTEALAKRLAATLDKPLPLPIVLENIERNIPQHGMNPFNCLDGVRQAGNERRGGH